MRRVPGLGLELRYALDGELRASRVHRDTATLAATGRDARTPYLEHTKEAFLAWAESLYPHMGMRLGALPPL